MKHSWLIDGVKCNFCTKCGVKNSRAYEECTVLRKNVKLCNEHRLIKNNNKYYLRSKRNDSPLYKEFIFDNNLELIRDTYECTACGTNNVPWGSYAFDFYVNEGGLYNKEGIPSFDQNKSSSYVVYYKHKNKKGEMRNYFYDTSSLYAPLRRSHLKDFDGKLYIHRIYCGLTDDDISMKDIIL
jgi:hypothetical protein